MIFFRSEYYFLHQNQNIFSATLGIRIFFLEKTITPTLEVEWSVPNWYSLLPWRFSNYPAMILFLSLAFINLSNWKILRTDQTFTFSCNCSISAGKLHCLIMFCSILSLTEIWLFWYPCHILHGELWGPNSKSSSLPVDRKYQKGQSRDNYNFNI